jgi:hypothetical protein
VLRIAGYRGDSSRGAIAPVSVLNLPKARVSQGVPSHSMVLIIRKKGSAEGRSPLAGSVRVPLTNILLFSFS